MDSRDPPVQVLNVSKIPQGIEQATLMFIKDEEKADHYPSRLLRPENNLSIKDVIVFGV